MQDPQTLRQAFEDALGLLGLDYSKSKKFWRPYLDFEMQELQDAPPEEKPQAVSRIRSIFRRRCYFPTSELAEAWTEYEAWEQDHTELLKVKQRHD